MSHTFTKKAVKQCAKSLQMHVYHATGVHENRADAHKAGNNMLASQNQNGRGLNGLIAARAHNDKI